MLLFVVVMVLVSCPTLVTAMSTTLVHAVSTNALSAHKVLPWSTTNASLFAATILLLTPALVVERVNVSLLTNANATVDSMALAALNKFQLVLKDTKRIATTIAFQSAAVSLLTTTKLVVERVNVLLPMFANVSVAGLVLAALKSFNPLAMLVSSLSMASA